MQIEPSRKTRLTPVTLGLRTTTTTEVQAGASPGDRVLLFPSDQVKEGGRVVARVIRQSRR